MDVDSDEKNELDCLRSIDTSLHNIEYAIYVMLVLLVFMLFFTGSIAFHFWSP